MMQLLLASCSAPGELAHEINCDLIPTMMAPLEEELLPVLLPVLGFIFSIFLLVTLVRRHAR